MIEIKNLSRFFGNLKAVDDISFTIDAGSITGFLGPNGAGKTTTMRMMVGFLQPSKGGIELDGVSIFDDPIHTSGKIGYLPEHNPLYDDMIVVEALRYIGDLRGLKGDRFIQRQDFVLQNCGLKEVRNQKIGTLSKGYRQRVGLAQAILHDPDILILDEPTSGLDPNQIMEIRELIRSLGREKTVILSSHIMQEVQALCDRVLIINKGKIIVDDEITRLSSYLSDFTLLNVEVEGEAVDFSVFLDEHPELELITWETEAQLGKLTLKIPTGSDARQQLARYIADHGWLVLNMSTERKSLEEIFHNLTTGEFTLPDKESEYLSEDDIEYFNELEQAPEPDENEPEDKI